MENKKDKNLETKFQNKNLKLSSNLQPKMKDKMSPKAEPNHPLRAGELIGIRRPKWDRDFLRWIMPNCQEIPFEKKHQNLNLRIAF